MANSHFFLYIGDWSNGMIGVSKTFGGSSILSSPAKWKPVNPWKIEGLRALIVDVNAKIKAVDYSPIKTGENVVVVTPTYAWRIPRIVSDWLFKTKLLSAKRIWFVMNCGSEIGNASKYNRSFAERKHLCYMGTSQILMPENYIAMFDAPQAEEARKIVKNAEPTIVDTIACIKVEQPFPVPRNNLYDRFMSDPVNVLKTAQRITLHLKMESRYGGINVLTVWHVFVIAPQKQ